jgi:hypothetical protein
MRSMVARGWVSEWVHGGTWSGSMGEQWCEDNAEWVMGFSSMS